MLYLLQLRSLHLTNQPYVLFQTHTCTCPDLCERGKCTSVWPVRPHHPPPTDRPPSKHKHFQVVCLSSVHAFRHTRTDAYLDSVYHALSGQDGIFVTSLLQPCTHTHTHTTRCNTKTRMNRVGKMKKRWEDRKRAEHKTGTGGRLSSPTIQI